MSLAQIRLGKIYKYRRTRRLTDGEVRRLFAEEQQRLTAEQLAVRCRRQGQRQQRADRLPELTEDRG